MIYLIFPILIFIGLSLADLLIAKRLLDLGLLEHCEVNPIATWLLECYGWAGLVSLKIAGVAGVSSLLVSVSHQSSKLAIKTAWIGCFLTALAVAFGVQALLAVPSWLPLDRYVNLV